MCCHDTATVGNSFKVCGCMFFISNKLKMQFLSSILQNNRQLYIESRLHNFLRKSSNNYRFSFSYFCFPNNGIVESLLNEKLDKENFSFSHLQHRKHKSISSISRMRYEKYKGNTYT